MEFVHYSVLLEESIEGLAIRPDGIYVDGTVGGAGHAVQIAKRLQSGRLIGLDQDPEAVAVARERLAPYPCAEVVQTNFSCMEEVLSERGISKVQGVLLDLGVSSHQLDEGARGFSYHQDAPLDMRMSKEGLSAYDIVNTFSVEEIASILWEYGEERFAKSIAAKIGQARQEAPIATTLQLAELIKESVPAKVRREKHPCKKSFQAIRIAVNRELEVLEEALGQAFDLLAPGGRLAVITFHSLEDRMVKRAFQSYCQGCTCPPEFPRCVCGKTPQAKLVQRKPTVASAKELQENHRSRSAKLRVLEKL